MRCRLFCRLTPTHLDDSGALPIWQRQLAQREAESWRDERAIATDLPEAWHHRPALLRALEITARRARADSTITPWLAVPTLLRSLKVTQAVLPCLTIGDKALRWSPRDTQAIVLRTLRTLTDRADEGLVRLQALEGDRLRAAAAIQGAHRPGKLLTLLSLIQHVPIVSPRRIMRPLNVTISGAGKLLSRAAELDLLVEVSGRQAWRTYLPRDLAIAFGYSVRPVGRPPALPRVLPDFVPALAAFDREMAEVDAMLTRIGVQSGLGPGTAVSEVQ
ncbi:hypothetical protein [uncultured Bradyrhizobium sp.]|uniref:hypothetical protein n=1 Tax=uncultured Bradyrhizobium sp. TaxID=199684 RepID=UPI002632A8DC|nr:hypothetical protein [uncultured Bradyrhizobium sp.]